MLFKIIYALHDILNFLNSQKRSRRGRPPIRRAPETLVPLPEEYIDESAYVPPRTVQSDLMPPQTGPPPPLEVVGGQIPLEQMA